MLILFAEISHADRGASNMQHLKRDYSLKVWGRLRGWGWDPGQNLTSLEYGHVAYQIKADDKCSNMIANILPTDTPSTQGWDQKVKP